MMGIGEILRHQYPDGGWLVQDNSDGRGAYLAEWDETGLGRPRPAMVELETWGKKIELTMARAARLSEIASGYDAALTATLTMPSNKPGAADIATEAALFAATDPVGLADVRAILAARRAELEAAVGAAQTVAAVRAVEVTYPV